MVFYKMASKLKGVPQFNVAKKRLHSTMTISKNVASSSKSLTKPPTIRMQKIKRYFIALVIV